MIVYDTPVIGRIPLNLIRDMACEERMMLSASRGRVI